MRHFVKFSLGFVILYAACLGFNVPEASAQETQGFEGTLTVRLDPDSREKTPVADVSIGASLDGQEVETSTSDEDGNFTIAVDEPGTYTITIDTETLPDGITLRDRANAGRTLDLLPGQTKKVAFPLLSDTTAGSETADFLGKVARLTVDGIRFGLILAMCSIGLSLVYGTTRLVNFAHGELVTIGAVAALALDGPLPFLAAAALAILITATAAAANEVGLWKPLRKRGTGLIGMLVISIGLSLLIRHLVLFAIGGDRQTYSRFTSQTGFDVGPLILTWRQVISAAICIVTLVGVAYFINNTKFGKAMRAVADNRDLAESSGIDVNRIISYVWIGGGLLAGLGGVLLGLDQQVRWDMGWELLLLIFAAVVLGGLGTSYGALLGSLVVGVFIQLSTLIIPPEVKNVGALLVLIVILLLRPQGILGRAERIG